MFPPIRAAPGERLASHTASYQYELGMPLREIKRGPRTKDRRIAPFCVRHHTRIREIRRARPN
jgi:hypothetical protein